MTEDLFAVNGPDDALVASRYRHAMNELLDRLGAKLPIEVGHGFDPITSRTELGDLFAELHPYSAKWHDRQDVAGEIRKNLWHLAYGDSRTTCEMDRSGSA